MTTLIKIWAIITHTFRESFAKKTFIAFFILSTILHLFFMLALSVDAVDGAMAMVKVFGENLDQTNLRDMVIKIEAGIASVGFFGGIFLSMFATSNFVPAMLEKGYIDLLISKPLSRTNLLLARFLGALSMVTFNVTYLILGNWLILSFKTGIWHLPYLYSILMIVVSFAIMYTLMCFTGVLSRSSGVTIMVAFSVFFLSYFMPEIINGIYALLSSKVYYYMLQGLYHSFLKSGEITKINLNLVLGVPVESWAPLWTSCLSGIAFLSLSTYIFSKKDF